MLNLMIKCKMEITLREKFVKLAVSKSANIINNDIKGLIVLQVYALSISTNCKHFIFSIYVRFASGIKMYEKPSNNRTYEFIKLHENYQNIL